MSGIRCKPIKKLQAQSETIKGYKRSRNDIQIYALQKKDANVEIGRKVCNRCGYRSHRSEECWTPKGAQHRDGLEISRRHRTPESEAPTKRVRARTQ